MKNVQLELFEENNFKADTLKPKKQKNNNVKKMKTLKHGQLNLFQNKCFYRLIEVSKITKFGIDQKKILLKYPNTQKIDRNKLVRLGGDLFVINKKEKISDIRITKESSLKKYQDVEQVDITKLDLINLWFESEIKFCIS